MHRCLRLASFLAAFAVTLPAVAELGTVRETGPERAPGFFDRAALQHDRTVLHGWLTSQQARGAEARPLVAHLTAQELDRIARPADDERRLLVGSVASLDASVSLAGRGPAFGGLERREDGHVWTGVVRSPGATALRLGFSSLDLPAGVELYVYNRTGEAFGPYTGRGPGSDGSLWSHTLTGDEAFVQLRVPNGARRADVGITIAEVGHMGPRFLLGALQGTGDGSRAFCNFNEPCIENASCSSIPQAIQVAQDAVAHMLFRSGGSFFICSGGLLADTDTSSQRPLFLTANHCIRREREANSLEAFFQFSTNCNGACYDPDGVVPSTLGATILEGNRNQDFTLMELFQPAPAGSAFLGWTNSAVAFSNNTSLFRISHPAGAPQAYSRQDVNTGAGTCSSLPRGNYIYSRDTFGGTEGGSSGSPVLNSSGQVVGQLFGACGTNVNDACDSASNATVDGAFAAYFSQIQNIVDPGTGCTDNDGDGFCAGNDCNDNDASVNPGAAELCGDMVDNDCDGAVDEGCGVCLPKGDACTFDSDCCSNKCKGNGTCR